MVGQGRTLLQPGHEPGPGHATTEALRHCHRRGASSRLRELLGELCYTNGMLLLVVLVVASFNPSCTYNSNSTYGIRHVQYSTLYIQAVSQKPLAILSTRTFQFTA